jgi:cation-transporting ATPase F
MQTLLSHHWHHLPVDELLELLETDVRKGLDVFEVKHRQEHFGPNALSPKKRKSALIRFLEQFNNPLIYILLIASVVTVVVKGPVDAAIVVVAVLVNTIIGYLQESRAEEAIEALAQTMSAEAAVLRAGEMQRVDARDLVPGDVVTLQAGDKVPADLRLVRTRDLQVAEAALTGESVPVQKASDVHLSPDTILPERRNMAYASTLVTYGQGLGIVVSTGDNTEIGRISQLLSAAQELQTPLTRNIARFSRLLVYVILGLSALAFLVGVLRGQPVLDMIITSIALAVATIPESLPTAVTVTLAIGVSRMARRRAIIRRLPAVEALGSTTVVCSDKTGTLTQNQMTVRQILAGSVRYQVSGAGYEPSGQITHRDEAAALDASPALAQCLQSGLLCNDSTLSREGELWQVQGDPTEGALVVSALKGGLLREKVEGQWPRLDVLPFDSAHQYMATLHRDARQDGSGGDRPRTVFLKGALEVILERCTGALAIDGQVVPLDRDAIHRAADEMAAEGLRVLAFARSELPPDAEHLDHEDVSTGLVFLGLQGMIDPPRPEAVAAVHACLEAGIDVKMITGDHPVTAAAIAEQVGLCRLNEGESCYSVVLTGSQIAALDDRELIEAAERVPVFGRVTPEQKLLLVEALQARGHVVAMTGDGVNDAPALKQANVGVAMGLSGTDVAKESADMVLTDDNFASIEAAVEEGRGVFDNLTKIISWALPTNLGEGLVILASILFGVALPILPVQILWVNMVTVIALELVLTLEPKEPDIMGRPPRAPNTPILTRTLVQRILLVGTLVLVGAFGLFEWSQAVRGATLAEARTVAVNAVVAAQLFYLLNARSLRYSILQIGFFSNPWLVVGLISVVVLQMGFTYLPFMNGVFETAPIDLQAWASILAFGLLVYVAVELEKGLRRRIQKKSHASKAPSTSF